MTTSVPIGEFSRLTHLTIKTLRHYHDLGLLTPYAIDEQSGYRRYAVDQVPTALLIGRLRGLALPLADVRRVVGAPDDESRDAAIAEHLSRMERELDRTRDIVASLRGLLRPMPTPAIGHRDLPSLAAVGISARVTRDDIGDWCGETFPDLYTRLLAGGGRPTGPGSALYDEAFFTEAVGEVTAFVPIVAADGTGGLPILTIPGGRFAIAVHAGPFVDFDRTYAALGSHVAEHDQPRTGPIREAYVAGPPEITIPPTFAPRCVGPSPRESVPDLLCALRQAQGT